MQDNVSAMARFAHVTVAQCRAQLNMKPMSHAVAAALRVQRSSRSMAQNLHVEQLINCQLQRLTIR